MTLGLRAHGPPARPEPHTLRGLPQGPAGDPASAAPGSAAGGVRSPGEAPSEGVGGGGRGLREPRTPLLTLTRARGQRRGRLPAGLAAPSTPQALAPGMGAAELEEGTHSAPDLHPASLPGHTGSWNLLLGLKSCIRLWARKARRPGARGARGPRAWRPGGFARGAGTPRRLGPDAPLPAGPCPGARAPRHPSAGQLFK